MNKGLTLIEILVVVAILSVILGFGMTIDLNVLKRNMFEKERSLIVSALERARSRTMANMFQSAHGICYVAPNYIIFRGRTTCSPLADEDEVIPANIDIAGNPNTTFPTVLFNRLTGHTNGKTIHITDGVKTADIIINNEGTINW